MVLSAISAVTTLVLLGCGHPLMAMAGVTITLALGAFQSLTGGRKRGPHEK